MKTRQDYVDMVTRPGKFEGEPAYVPYFWEIAMEGGALPSRAPNVDCIEVTNDDRLLFPELKHRRSVRLRYHDDGFVTED